jgi:alkylated DNA repair dioxygenase AlkB
MEVVLPAAETNLLPCDGTVHYHGVIFAPPVADTYLMSLGQEIAWQHDEVIIFGKRIITARKVAWYGDRRVSYKYSGIAREALPWSPMLLDLKRAAEAHSGAVFNSCLLNLYHDGGEGMAWHSDDEKSLVWHGAIASLSFGAERRFCFKHKRMAHTEEVVLGHGSLLVMKDETQTHWRHCLPKAKRIKSPRINLTFRTMAFAS